MTLEARLLREELGRAGRNITSLTNENNALRAENERLRHDLLDAQTAQAMAEAELREVQAIRNEVQAIRNLLPGADYGPVVADVAHGHNYAPEDVTIVRREAP